MCPGRVRFARREVWMIAHLRRPSRMALAPVRWLCRGSLAAVFGKGANCARVDRRGRKHPNRSITAGVVGSALFVAAWIPPTGGPFDHTQPPAARGPTVRTMSDGTRSHPSLDLEKRQRRRTGNKKVGALGIATAIGAIAGASTLGTLRDRTRQHRPTSRWWPRGPPSQP